MIVWPYISEGAGVEMTWIFYWPQDVRCSTETSLEEAFLSAWLASNDEPFLFQGFLFEFDGGLPCIREEVAGYCFEPWIFSSGLRLAKVRLVEHILKRGARFEAGSFVSHAAKSRVDEGRATPKRHWTIITVGTTIDAVTDLHTQVRRGKATPETD